jgi:small subunit ribosomal protein S16
MAVVIRMRRTGRKNRPCFRINVADSRFPRDGRLIESLGLYDPIRRDEAAQVQVDVERARYWLSQGAKPSETVASIFKRKGVFEPKPFKKRERPGRKVATKTHARREASKAARAERKALRVQERRKAARAAKAAAAATSGSAAS